MIERRYGRRELPAISYGCFALETPLVRYTESN